MLEDRQVRVVEEAKNPERNRLVLVLLSAKSIEKIVRTRGIRFLSSLLQQDQRLAGQREVALPGIFGEPGGTLRRQHVGLGLACQVQQERFCILLVLAERLENCQPGDGKILASTECTDQLCEAPNASEDGLLFLGVGLLVGGLFGSHVSQEPS
jgi:hypothetical protein